MTPSPTLRPGGRTARTEQVVLAATIAELSARPYAEISVESVAARAGVHKTTVYRRWHTLAELVATAVGAAAQQRIAVPDTGAIGSDLRELARAVQTTLASPEGAATTRSLLAAAAGSPEVATVMQRFWQTRLDAVAVIVERAAERGDLPHDTDPVPVLQTLVAPLYYRLLVTAEPLRPDDADRAAATAELAARQGVFGIGSGARAARQAGTSAGIALPP